MAQGTNLEYFCCWEILANLYARNFTKINKIKMQIPTVALIREISLTNIYAKILQIFSIFATSVCWHIKKGGLIRRLLWRRFARLFLSRRHDENHSWSQLAGVQTNDSWEGANESNFGIDKIVLGLSEVVKKSRLRGLRAKIKNRLNDVDYSR